MRHRLRALEDCFVFDAEVIEVGDPLVECLPTGDLKRQVVESGAPRAEHLPVSVGMVVEAYEQAGAGTRHHDGVAVTGPVRFGEASDQAQNLAVPSLTGADVSDRETASASGSETPRTTGSEPCSMPANLTGACWARFRLLLPTTQGLPSANTDVLIGGAM